MQDRYPFLHHWMKQGFRKFPSVPPEELRKALIESARNSFKKRQEADPLSSIFSGTPFSDESLFEFTAGEALEVKMEELSRRLARESFNRFKKATGMIKEGRERSEANRKLTGSLPGTRGGASIYTKLQKAVLKEIYRETQDSIKEVRRKLNVPLKNTEDSEWPPTDVFLEDIFDRVPNVLNVFRESELWTVVERPSIKETALSIMWNRLKPCLRNPMSPRTLGDIIDKAKSLQEILQRLPENARGLES